MSSFAERLKKLRGDMSVSAFARKVGIGDTLMRKYLDGATPGLDKVVQIARALDVDVAWLATGEGSPEGAEASGDVVRVPLLRWRMEPPGNDEDASAPPWEEKAATVGYLPLTRELLGELGVAPEAARLMWMEQPRLEIDLFPGDLLLIDTSRRDALAGGLYVFTSPGASLVSVERAVPTPDGQVRLGEFIRTPAELEHMNILGRVVWVWRKAR